MRVPPTFRFWTEADADALRPLIFDYLFSTRAIGGDLLLTDNNVELLLALGLGWAAAGEPTLVAVRDGELVGFTLWGSWPNPLGFDFRNGPLCAAMGTYVAPEARRQGVGWALRQAAFRVALERGYARVQGVTYDEPGWHSAHAAGFEVVARQVEHALKEAACQQVA